MDPSGRKARFLPTPGYGHPVICDGRMVTMTGKAVISTTARKISRKNGTAAITKLAEIIQEPVIAGEAKQS